MLMLDINIVSYFNKKIRCICFIKKIKYDMDIIK